MVGKQARQWHFDLSGTEVKLDYEDLVDRDPWRLPLPIDREGYQTVETSHFYWASGHMDWLNVNQAVAEFGLTSSKPIRIFDMACASGRFLRHVCAFGGENFEAWGADLAHANIAWIKKYLPKDIRAMTNTVVPHLPFEDHFFDVITGFSFMPHIEHLEDAWLMELRRITKPGGLLYLTIANEATWHDAVNREVTINHFVQTNSVPGNEPMSKATFEAPIPGPKFVRRTCQDPVYNCYIWHTNEYIQTSWSRYFQIDRIVDFAHARHQAVVLARR